MSIIDQFSKLTKPGLQYCFDDNTLKKIAKETQKPLTEVVDTIAKHYLRVFPTTDGGLMFSKSDKLKARYAKLHPLYREIVQALSDGADVGQLQSVRDYLAEFSGIGGSRKSQAIEQLKQQALMVHEVTRTFPTRFQQVRHLVKFSEDDMTEELYQCLESPTQACNPIKMAPFFYKHIAVPGKTWADLAKEWVITGGNGVRLSRVISSFPLHWVFPIVCVTTHTEHTLSFREYTQKKTWEAFLEMLEIKADLPVPKELHDEEFRMDLVFHMLIVKKEGLIAEKPDPQTKAYRWLLAARRFLRLQNEVVLGNHAGEVLMWCLHARQQDAQFKEWDEFTALAPPPRKSDGKYIELIASLKEGMEENAFLHYALIYLLILEEHSRKYGLVQSTYLILKEYDRTYCAFEPEALRRFLMDNKGIDLSLAKAMPEILLELECRGKSPLFFELILGFLRPEQVRRYADTIKEILKQLELFPQDTDTTIRLLKNASLGWVKQSTLQLLFAFQERFGKLSQEDRLKFLCTDLVEFPEHLSPEAIEAVLGGLEQIRPKFSNLLLWQLMGMGCFLASLGQVERITKKILELAQQPSLQENSAFARLRDQDERVTLPDGVSSYNVDAINWCLGRLGEKFTISLDERKAIGAHLASLKHPPVFIEITLQVVQTHSEKSLTASDLVAYKSVSQAPSEATLTWCIGTLKDKFTVSADDEKSIRQEIASIKDPQKIGEKVLSVLNAYDQGTTLTATQFIEQGSSSRAVLADEC